MPAWVVEPFVSVARKTDRVLFYGFDGIAKHFVVGVWVATRQWAGDHPDLVSRFAAAMHDTAVWANKNPQQSGDILAKYVKIDPAVIATMTRNHYAEQLSPGLMQPLNRRRRKIQRLQNLPGPGTDLQAIVSDDSETGREPDRRPDRRQPHLGRPRRA